VCSSCGHSQADDQALMAGQLPGRLAASAAGSGRVSGKSVWLWRGRLKRAEGGLGGGW
jgi:hypothetical protein